MKPRIYKLYEWWIAEVPLKWVVYCQTWKTAVAETVARTK